MHRLPALIALFVAAAPLALAQAPGEERRYFSDWLAACRADGYCSATTYQNPNPGGGLVADHVLRVGRHAEQTYWEVSLTTVAAFADETAPFVVAVDGEPEAFSGSSEVAAFGAANDFYLLGRKAQAVMDRLAPGGALSVDFTDVEGRPVTAAFSLRGLTAALIWIDERQGRLGSERVAEAPPFGLPRVTGDQPFGDIGVADLPAGLLALHAARGDACEPVEYLRATPTAHDLGADGQLFFIPCSEGAYNYWYAAYLGTNWGYELLHFAAYGGDGWISEDGVWLPDFDPQAGVLETYNLGRSAGDCGVASRHLWRSGRFVLTRVNAKPECDGEGEAGEFPLVFEAPESAD